MNFQYYICVLSEKYLSFIQLIVSFCLNNLFIILFCSIYYDKYPRNINVKVDIVS